MGRGRDRTSRRRSLPRAVQAACRPGRRRWFSLRGQLQRARDDAERWQLYTQIQSGLLQALGYDAPPDASRFGIELAARSPVPLASASCRGSPSSRLTAGRRGRTTCSTTSCATSTTAATPVPKPLARRNLGRHALGRHLRRRHSAALCAVWSAWTTGCCSTATNGPTTARCASTGTTSSTARTATPSRPAPPCCTRTAWHRTRAPACSKRLDENAHKHAFGVSEDLKYALREAIELLGNEAARQLRQQAADAKKGFFSGKDQLDPGELSLECLRLVYRLLFMFYIEARPELGYVPIGKSEVYLKGYSLESLRDLEMQPLNTPHARDGFYFDATLRRLFRLVAQGCGLGEPVQASWQLGCRCARIPSPWLRSTAACSTTAPCRCWTRCVSQPCLAARHPAHVALPGAGKGTRSGRVSYQLLSINQLGAVYEALLSYRGFFAAEDLYEVKPAPKKGRAADDGRGR